jgi:hypothetical protein
MRNLGSIELTEILVQRSALSNCWNNQLNKIYFFVAAGMAADNFKGTVS